MLVQVHGSGEVRKPCVDLITERPLCEETRLARERLDGHPLQDGLKCVELGREGNDRVGTGEEAPRGRHHEGWEGVVIWTGVVQDVEGRSSKGSHLV